MRQVTYVLNQSLEIARTAAKVEIVLENQQAVAKEL